LDAGDLVDLRQLRILEPLAVKDKGRLRHQ
jgi:hypothetical protein